MIAVNKVGLKERHRGHVWPIGRHEDGGRRLVRGLNPPSHGKPTFMGEITHDCPSVLKGICRVPIAGSNQW
jgi:hypothetical protein